MRIESLSTRTLIVLCLMGLFVATFAFTYVLQRNYQESTLSNAESFLREIANVSTDAALHDLHKAILIFGNTLISRPEFIKGFEAALAGNPEPLESALSDPFRSGYVNATTIALEGLRTYRPDWSLLAQGRTEGPMTVDPMPLEATSNAVLEGAAKRQGVAKLRAYGGVWVSAGGPFYSVILPVGGLTPEGYLEIVANPSHNLPRLEEIIRQPVRIVNVVSGETVHDSGPSLLGEEGVLKSRYRLMSEGGQPAYDVTVYVDNAAYLADIRNFQVNTLILGTLVNLSVLALVLLLLNRFLIGPLENLRREIRRHEETLHDDPVPTRGVREFNELARDFNHLIDLVRQQNMALNRLSKTDELTRLPNRRALNAFLEAEWQRAKRTQESIGVILMDIDCFKNYNDTYGHQAGDDCLRAVAEVIRDAVPRGTDFVARYGGEEFIVVMPHTVLDGALEVAQRIATALRRRALPHVSTVVGKTVSLSLGVATCVPLEGLDSSCLIELADENLYAAKSQGRDRWVGTDGQSRMALLTPRIKPDPVPVSNRR
ncbi:hypothetical protein JCM17960_23880 [Magnetospira thiophila]